MRVSQAHLLQHHLGLLQMPQNGEGGLESVSLNPVDSSLLANLENMNTRWLLRSSFMLWFIIYINNSLERRCGMMMILQLYVLYLLNIISYEPQFSFINTCGHTLYFPLQNKSLPGCSFLMQLSLGFSWHQAFPTPARGGHASLGAQQMIPQTPVWLPPAPFLGW